jgi:hypothetical protein
MRFSEPFPFWALSPDGKRAHDAYEHVHSYYCGASIQYGRIYELWRASSEIAIEGGAMANARTKRFHMQQVVRDVHCLLVFIQVIWRTLTVMSDPELYPHFVPLVALRAKWQPYFKQYLAPRDTFEHYEDQVLGRDSRKNSPGFGLSLSAAGGFSLGSHTKVPIDQTAFEQLQRFMSEFDEAVARIIEPTAIAASDGTGSTAPTV